MTQLYPRQAMKSSLNALYGALAEHLFSTVSKEDYSLLDGADSLYHPNTNTQFKSDDLFRDLKDSRPEDPLLKVNSDFYKDPIYGQENRFSLSTIETSGSTIVDMMEQFMTGITDANQKFRDLVRKYLS